VTTLRCDVLVLGSTLGALVAGTYLARTGLRVVLIEEEIHARRPALLREPFLLSGLETGGPLDSVVRELAIPLLERRDLVHDALALQLVLPGGVRVDVGRGRKALAAELDACGVCPADMAESWLGVSDAAAEALRERLRETPTPAARGLPGRLAAFLGEPEIEAADAADPPPALAVFAQAHADALSSYVGPLRSAARGLLVYGVRDGAAHPVHAGRGLNDLLRRRFLALHGEIRSARALGLRSERRALGVELRRETIFARALVLGVPRQPLAKAVAASGEVPTWLSGPEPAPRPRVLLRADDRALPIGMGARLASAPSASGPGFSVARFADPSESRTEWLVVSGPGAREAGTDLGGLAPFSDGRIARVEPEPGPVWDLDGVELEFAEPRAPATLRRQPNVVLVGPERAPELGLDGELLLARRTALLLARSFER
jgi:hypothetical protein